MKLEHFKMITEALTTTESSNLEKVSLRGLNFFQLPTIEGGKMNEEQQKRHEISNECIDDLATFIAESLNLQHLDLSGMSLGGKNALRLAKNGLSQSRSLLSVHLA